MKFTLIYLATRF